MGSQSTMSTPTGVMIPLYSYPGNDWNIVEQAKLAHPSVPIVVIINPDNGPGGSKDTNYVAGVNNLRSAGVIVLGYVYTSYAARASASVIADINTYKSWYNVSGIFFDEMSNVQGNAGYYSALSNYAKSIGFEFTVGNPGETVPASYLGSVDCIVAYENEGLPNISSLVSMDSSFSKNGIAAISYGVNVLSTSYTNSASNYIGYIYVTDAGLPNPYSELPSYFLSLVSALDTSSMTSSTSAATKTVTDTTSQSSTVANSVTNIQTVTTSTPVLANSIVTSTPLNSTAAITSAPTKAMSATTILLLAVVIGASALAAILTVPAILSKKTRFDLLLRKRRE